MTINTKRSNLIKAIKNADTFVYKGKRVEPDTKKDVLLYVQDSKLYIVGTDGKKIYKEQVECEIMGEDTRCFILPTKHILSLLKERKGLGEELILFVYDSLTHEGEKQIIFTISYHNAERKRYIQYRKFIATNSSITPQAIQTLFSQTFDNGCTLSKSDVSSLIKVIPTNSKLLYMDIVGNTPDNACGEGQFSLSTTYRGKPIVSFDTGLFGGKEVVTLIPSTKLVSVIKALKNTDVKVSSNSWKTTLLTAGNKSILISSDS